MIILKYTIGLDTNKYCEKALSGSIALQMVIDDFEAQEQTAGKKSKYTLILMDCNMPGMDGFETTDKIREFLYSKHADQPIISAITGHMEQMYIDKAIMSGMNQVLSKPVNKICLHEIVKSMGFPLSRLKL
jgi:CheY-like chemotaxis protein